MFLCVLILFQNASSQHRSRLFSRYKAVSITDKQTIHKTDNPRSKKKKGGKLKCRHQSLSKAIILGYTHHALAVCLSVCLCLCLCVCLLHPPPPPSSAHSQGSLVICVVWMYRRVVLWDWELMHFYIMFVYRLEYVDMSTSLRL